MLCPFNPQMLLVIGVQEVASFPFICLFFGHPADHFTGGGYVFSLNQNGISLMTGLMLYFYISFILISMDVHILLEYMCE